jgi:hypothetical protein
VVEYVDAVRRQGFLERWELLVQAIQETSEIFGFDIEFRLAGRVTAQNSGNPHNN